MKLTIQSYGATYSADLGDDATVPEVVRAFVNLMVSASYSRQNLIDLFIDGDPQNWDDAWS